MRVSVVRQCSSRTVVVSGRVAQVPLDEVHPELAVLFLECSQAGGLLQIVRELSRLAVEEIRDELERQCVVRASLQPAEQLRKAKSAEKISELSSVEPCGAEPSVGCLAYLEILPVDDRLHPLHVDTILDDLLDHIEERGLELAELLHRRAFKVDVLQDTGISRGEHESQICVNVAKE